MKRWCGGAGQRPATPIAASQAALLAEALVAEAALEKPVLLALPRGGVPVAAEVAARLNAPLGLILVRKIGVPGRSELAMGALAMIHGQISEFRNDEIVDGLAYLEPGVRGRAQPRKGRARASRQPLSVPRSPVSRIRPSSLSTTASQPARPCWPRSRLSGCFGRPRSSSPFRWEHDKPCELCGQSQICVVCLSAPEPFIAVGAAYQDFRQLSDEEVVTILNQFSS